jgi:hypothetical protein
MKKHVIALILILFTTTIFAEEGDINWVRITGRWTVERDLHTSYMVQHKQKAYQWGYNPLINANTIISGEVFDGYTGIEAEFTPVRPYREGQYVMIPFAIEDYRNLYGVRLSGTINNLNKAAFIQSRTKDTTRPRSEKWNFEMAEHKSAKIDVSYNNPVRVRLVFSTDKTVELLINGEKVMDYTFKNPVNSGRLGISSYHVSMKVDRYTIKKNSEVLLDDEFTEDTIKRFVVKGELKKKDDDE